MKTAMNICETTGQALNFSLDPKLAEIEIERHAASCPPCRRFLAERRQIKNLLQRAARGEAGAPARLRDSIRLMIRQGV